MAIVAEHANAPVGDDHSLQPLEQRGEAGGRRREQLAPGPELQLESAIGHERGHTRPEQSYRHHDLVTVPGHVERLLEANVAARQIGVKRDAAGTGLLGVGRREAQALEIHDRTGTAEAEPRLRRIVGAGEPDRGARSRVGLRARGMAGAPGHGVSTVQREHEFEPVGRDAHPVGAGLVGRNGAGDRAEQEKADEQGPASHQR